MIIILETFLYILFIIFLVKKSFPSHILYEYAIINVKCFTFCLCRHEW